jgi:hypothetical protein
MSKTYINIGGQTIEPPANLPDRKFREAWVLDGQGGVTLDPTKRAEIAQKLFEDAIEAHIEAAAADRGYANSTRLASYVASTTPAWKAEAEAFVAWRDDVWAYAFIELEKVLAGQRDEPTIEAFVEELPLMEWPG